MMKSFCMIILILAGCGDGAVTSEEDARKAYMGLDQMVEKAMNLGFKGYAEAKSANIPQQTAAGAEKGTLTLDGKVDQGSSNNKGMQLTFTLTDYVDVPGTTYNTGTNISTLNMSLKKIPDGTMTGTLSGTFQMSGDLEGEVTLSLTLTSDLEADSAVAGGVKRKATTIKVNGTANSQYGNYEINISR